MASDHLARHHFDLGPGDLDLRKQLRTTHRRIWQGAALLLKWLSHPAVAEALGLHRPGLRILELGSGSGWLGLNLAALYTSASVTMSDLPEVLPVLQAQIDRVALTEDHGVVAVAFDWLATDPAIIGAQWDLVLGSDLLYSHATTCALADVMAALAEPPRAPRMVYAHVPGRKASVDASYHATFAGAGLGLTSQPRPDREPAAECAEAVAVAATDGADDDEGMPWLQDGGLFAEEDQEYRLSQPGMEIFDVGRLGTGTCPNHSSLQQTPSLTAPSTSWTQRARHLIMSAPSWPRRTTPCS